MKIRRMLKHGGLALATLLLLGATRCELRFGDEGRLDLRLTDAPLDTASEVWLTIEGVELRDVDGRRERLTLAMPRRLNLLELSNGVTTLLFDDAPLPSGEYASIKLLVRGDPQSSDSFVQLKDGRSFPLYVPQDDEPGLRASYAFDIDDGKRTRLTLDIDLRRSLREPDPDVDDQAWRLVPSLRLIEDRRSGRIEGRIAADRLSGDCAPAVYLYRDRVTPDDIGGAGAQPLTSSQVFTSGGEFVYAAAFLPPGDYTVAFTCEADRDDPEDDDDLDLVVRYISVEAQATAVRDF